MRKLAPEEAELWARVAATIRPLSREPVNLPPPTEAVKPAVAVKAPRGRVPPPRPAVLPVTPPRRFDRHGLDSHWERRLRSGTIEPDRVLDLHGHSLDTAWTAIDRALDEATRRGERVLLFITGHARAGEPPIQRGKIRAAVGDWLAASRHSGHILAVRGAHKRHGGGGSLYIILSR